MGNGRRLAQGAIDGRRHGRHVRVRGNYDGRAVGLELPRRHHVLVRLRVLVRVMVPLLLHLRRIRRRVRSSIVVLGVVRIGVVVDWRVCLRGYVMVIVLVLALPPSLMERDGRRYVRAWHHCRRATMEPSQSALARDRATNL
jgi:hypothetical protein